MMMEAKVKQLREAANQAHAFLSGLDGASLQGHDGCPIPETRLQEVYTLLNQAGCGPPGSRELVGQATKAKGG